MPYAKYTRLELLRAAEEWLLRYDDLKNWPMTEGRWLETRMGISARKAKHLATVIRKIQRHT